MIVTAGAWINLDLHPDKNDMLMRGMGGRHTKLVCVIYGCISFCRLLLRACVLLASLSAHA